ncbi:MAG: hypothetical protein ACFFCS_05395 [Candidatus Hodarchaeota archaeon]
MKAKMGLMKKKKRGERREGFQPDQASRLKKLALEAWEEAVYDMYNPNIPEPVISFNEDYKEPFYIDITDWTVHLNLFHAPSFQEADFKKFTRSISHHELGHYCSCPYDGVTNALMLQAARKVLGDNYAPIACNIVSDLIIEHGLSHRFKDLSAWRFDESLKKIGAGFDKQPPSKTWKLVVQSEAILTGKEAPKELLKSVDFDDVKTDARKIAKLVQKDINNMNSWASLTGKVSKILLKYIKEEFPAFQTRTKPDPSSNLRNVPGKENTSIKIPEDVLEQLGDVSKTSDRDNGRLNEKSLKRSERKGAGKDEPGDDNSEKILGELAKESDTFGDFGGPAVALGLVRKEHALATWYRNRSAGLINVEIIEETLTGSLPVSPATWRLGDPLESLDLTLTLLNSPVIIPNLTTRRWEYHFQTGLQLDETYPDFLIVIDSSYSMGWKPNSRGKKAKGEYDVALVAAFAAIHFARKKGIEMASINFSGFYKACDWTKDVEEIERNLLEYEGDGTVLPTPAIIDMVEDQQRPTLIFIISDAGLYNWSSGINPLMKLVEKGHHIVFFLIGGRKNQLKAKKFIQFMDKGGKIHVIGNVNDLIGLVITEIKETYSKEVEEKVEGESGI